MRHGSGPRRSIHPRLPPAVTVTASAQPGDSAPAAASLPSLRSGPLPSRGRFAPRPLETEANDSNGTAAPSAWPGPWLPQAASGPAPARPTPPAAGAASLPQLPAGHGGRTTAPSRSSGSSSASRPSAPPSAPALARRAHHSAGRPLLGAPSPPPPAMAAAALPRAASTAAPASHAPCPAPPSPLPAERPSWAAVPAFRPASVGGLPRAPASSTACASRATAVASVWPGRSWTSRPAVGPTPPPPPPSAPPSRRTLRSFRC
mmetsp:Transcript_3551/g.14755  ORF Transcript_3551/g.14755 Transcript_3551/m.14755 type:complete len:261 (+) Transcript_3551:321-1103(+)